MVILALFMKYSSSKTLERAIAEKKLASGLFSFFPVEGEQAVVLAKGYIRGFRIVFWFQILFLPFLFVLDLIRRTS